MIEISKLALGTLGETHIRYPRKHGENAKISSLGIMEKKTAQARLGLLWTTVPATVWFWVPRWNFSALMIRNTGLKQFS